MSRGDRREDIFRDDTDRKGFLATRGQACEKTGWSRFGTGSGRNAAAQLVRRDEVAVGDLHQPLQPAAPLLWAEQVMERRRFEADGEDYKGPEHAWCLATEQFRAQLLAQVRRRLGPNHFGPERRESAEARATRVIGGTLAGLRMTPARLQSLPAKAGVKVELARRLRRQTTISLKWIASQLGIDSWKYLPNLLGQRAPSAAQPELGV